MAEREHLTNRQRREQARADRKRREAEAVQQRQRGAWRNGAITFVVVALVGFVVFQAFANRTDPIEDAILVSASEAEDARGSASCEYVTHEEPLEDRTHVDNANQVDPDSAYTDVRPTHSGPHTAGVHPVIPDATSQIDEVSSTHNLEHGTVIVWWDPEQVDASTASEIGDWAETLNASGFRRDEAGVGIISSPYEDPGIDSGQSIAFRAWGVAMDCDEWDETVANAFVLEHFGTEGIGPERVAAGFPTGVLAYAEEDGATGGDDEGATEGDDDGTATDGADADDDAETGGASDDQGDESTSDQDEG